MGNVDVDAAVLYSGTCGENASWTLDSDGNLVFSGTGDIIFSDMDIPIKDYFEIVDNISNIIIEKGLTGVEGIGFISNCEKLKSISISDTVTKIGFAAFSGATRLTNIEIPKSVTTIGSSAFSGCIGLTKIEISNSITEIGANSFAECTGLTKIEIPKSVTTIESGAFSGCTRLTSITLRNVFSIGDNLFEGCDNLLTIRLLRAINDLPEKTFFDCTQLKELWIKGGFKEIKTNTFRYCSALTDVFYGGSEEEWKTINIKGYNDFLLNANINYYLCSEGSLEHTWDQGTITVAATCTTDGMKTYVCKKMWRNKRRNNSSNRPYRSNR